MSQIILPKDVDSKFRFITVAAQRAKQLQNGAKPRVEMKSRKPTRVAMQEVLANAVSYMVSAPVQADRTGDSLAALNADIGDFLSTKGYCYRAYRATLLTSSAPLCRSTQKSANTPESPSRLAVGRGFLFAGSWRP